MNKLLYISVFVLALCAIVVTATSSEEEKFTLEQLLAQPQTLDKAKLTAFSYTNCGSESDPSKLTQLNISPDPIMVGQAVNITAKGFLSANISSGEGYTMSLEIYKKVFGVPIYVPCVSNVGSCTYDLCGILPPTANCPLQPWGVPCSCPLAAGSYQVPVPGFSFPFPNLGISWLLDGEILVSVTLADKSGSRLACYKIDATISS
ncbi:ganglioside gm2 activator precursor, putative [Acanthamoeba castellanii str. Neff]|uniref:Ganglioside gm2 activator, putative n=1 Tax=Acanthamoeba castellanii (strain ATCC 30010 / Neff) TaxID=1257118 RepID=L8GNQ2_ACACF|nr:ganglioside gm2 activator precursor, putative [Acanthamoeba castellanii str. Neff]ELR14489.1 ganglioside gm2 activator precursor, putative [Acanthamoeba castellanii str. Neff]